jgi:hypothetical protein
MSAALLGAVAGCASLPKLTDGAYNGPFYAPKNFTGDAELPANLRRVLLLPVCGGTVAEPESAAALDPVILNALQRQTRFEVVTISREECQRHFGATEFASTAALPPDFLARLAEAYAADAVMFVDLTHYRPYRPLGVGFRAKLATVKNVRLIWAFDEIFSAENPAILNSIRREHLDTGPTDLPVDLTFATLQSPGRFAAFAADAMFRTLPPR